MRKCYLFILCCISKSFALSSTLTCSQVPIASSSPFLSVLHTWPKEYLEYVGERKRISTCTGVIWLENNTLFSIGVHNLSLDTYHFDQNGPALVASKSENLSTFQKTKLGQLENIAISPDGSLAAISNNGKAAIHFYKIAGEELTHLAEIPKVGWWVHGVRFSRGMDYLAYTLFGDPGKIMLFRILENEEGAISFKLSQAIDIDVFPLQPKGLDFSMDERFLIVCHAINNSSAPNSVRGAIAVYPFDKINGTIDPSPVSVIGTSEALSVPEDLCFSPDGSSFLVTNHANDTVTIHRFDQITGKIGESRVLLQNPESCLSFPHGLCFSPDGKYLAVTNYGDDSVKIYAVFETE